MARSQPRPVLSRLVSSTAGNLPMPRHHSAPDTPLSRRDLLRRGGMGLGLLGLAGVLADDGARAGSPSSSALNPLAPRHLRMSSLPSYKDRA